MHSTEHYKFYKIDKDRYDFFLGRLEKLGYKWHDHTEIGKYRRSSVSHAQQDFDMVFGVEHYKHYKFVMTCPTDSSYVEGKEIGTFEELLDMTGARNSPPFRDGETIRAISINYIRNGDKSKLKLIHEHHQFAGMYPHKMSMGIASDGKTFIHKCPNCESDKHYEIGYDNHQCDVCYFVFKINNQQ